MNKSDDVMRDENAISEQLSAMMDDELEQDTSRFLLNRMKHDVTLQRKWDRYRIIQSCICDEAIPHSDQQILSGVRAAIAGEPLPSKRVALRWYKPFAGAAIAASTALLVVAGFRVQNLDFDSSTVVAEQQTIESRQPDMSALMQPVNAQIGQTSKQIRPANHQAVFEQRMNRYLRVPQNYQAQPVSQSVSINETPVRYVYLVRQPVDQNKIKTLQPGSIDVNDQANQVKKP